MGGVTKFSRDARIKLQAYDDGDPDELVWFRKHRSRSPAKVYHDDETCANINNSQKVITGPRHEVQARWKAPCQHCVLGWVKANNRRIDGKPTLQEALADD